MRILIAEDDQTSRNMLAGILAHCGHEVVSTEDGNQAWAEMQKADPPRVLILDRIMPGMDGLALCSRIRATMVEPRPYIIMLTIKGSKADIVDGLATGADDYISKPYDPAELCARVDVAIRMVTLQHDLAERVRERDILLHEVHHRMKNNMNTIQSVLGLQADALTDQVAVSALHDARSRLTSMSILYDRLFRSSDVKRMAVRDYLPVLVEEIVDQFPKAEWMSVQTDLGDFDLAARLLTNLGLIINELTTNAAKYAVTPGSTTTIRLTAQLEGDTVVLGFSDDGPGLPDGIDCETSTGFGLRLVGILTDQIGGSIHIGRQGGTTYTIRFPVR